MAAQAANALEALKAVTLVVADTGACLALITRGPSAWRAFRVQLNARHPAGAEARR